MGRTVLKRVAVAALVMPLWLCLAHAAPKHGIAMIGEPALPADYKSLPYANPDAPQGGILRQAITGSFDSVSPFIVKGNPAKLVRTYVFESLMGRSWDEPFSLYGLLAESIDVSDDRQTFTFKIRPEAKFSDGKPVTAADVVFSMNILRDKGLPYFKDRHTKIKTVETPDDHTVVFHQDRGDRELPLLMGLMPIIPKHVWEGKAFDQTTVEPLIGSGPYVMGEIKPGESITYKKNPDYWGKNLPINKGVWNFDAVRLDYYRDANAAFEAFKKGEADIRQEDDPVRWTSAYDFPAVSEGKVIKEIIAQGTPAKTSGFAFNTRRKIFEDPRVREALAMLFDFEWMNANIYGGVYQRIYGYYSGSELSSKGKPLSEGETKILGAAADGLRADFKDGSYTLPVSDGSGQDRAMLRKAVELLGQAGWTVQDTGLANAAGEPLAFTISVQTKDQEKLALAYQRSLSVLGIKADVRLVDNAQFQSILNSYDYDMVPVIWYNSLSPGNEQKFYYGSDGRKQEGTRNYPGIANPGVDAAIAALLTAPSRPDFVTAVQALDRMLVSGFYIVPFYDAGGQWVARWSHIGRPEKQPLTGFEATTLWRVQ